MEVHKGHKRSPNGRSLDCLSMGWGDTVISYGNSLFGKKNILTVQQKYKFQKLNSRQFLKVLFTECGTDVVKNTFKVENALKRITVITLWDQESLTGGKGGAGTSPLTARRAGVSKLHVRPTQRLSKEEVAEQVPMVTGTHSVRGCHFLCKRNSARHWGCQCLVPSGH